MCTQKSWFHDLCQFFSIFLIFRVQKGAKIYFLSFKTHENLFLHQKFCVFFMSPKWSIFPTVMCFDVLWSIFDMFRPVLGTRREVSEVIMNVTIETPHHEIVNDDELLETKIMPTSITDGTRGAIASRTVMVCQITSWLTFYIFII